MSTKLCMNAHTLEEEDVRKRIKSDWDQLVIEPKIDGARMLVAGGDPISRGDKAFAHLGRVMNDVERMLGASLGDMVLDGELWAGSWNETMSIIRAMKSERDNRKLRYIVFDVIPKKDWERRVTPDLCWLERQEWLRDLIDPGDRSAVQRIPQNPFGPQPKSWADLQRQLKIAESRGYEGLMVKRKSGLYQFKRTWDWMKVIRRPMMTVEVKDVLRGKGKHAKRLGKLLCVTDDGVEVKCDGMTDELRDRWWGDPSLIVGKRVEVTCKEVNVNGKLRQPKYVRIRDEMEG